MAAELAAFVRCPTHRPAHIPLRAGNHVGLDVRDARPMAERAGP